MADEQQSISDDLIDELVTTAVGNIRPVPIYPEWQQIETAPKDGTPLLLFGPDGKTGIGFIEEQEFDDARWFHSTAAWVGKDAWRNNRTNVTFGGYAPEEATHWMPLPEPPAITAGTRSAKPT